MGETTMNYEQKYKEALEKLQEALAPTENGCKISGLTRGCIENIFPELRESENKRIKEEIKIILANTDFSQFALDYTFADMINWLEKQNNTNETVNRNEFAQSVLRGAAINLITWIDYNTIKGNMCLSNIECKDIEDALVNGNWDTIYAYIKKKLEK